MIDANLNDARQFLVSIIEDPSSVPRSRELAYKIIILLGVVRANVEDLLLVSTLLDKHKHEVDLRDELNQIKGDAVVVEDPKKISYETRTQTKRGDIFYLQAGSKAQNLTFKAALATDSQYLFVHQEGLGLVKMSTGQ